MCVLVYLCMWQEAFLYACTCVSVCFLSYVCFCVWGCVFYFGLCSINFSFNAFFILFPYRLIYWFICHNICSIYQFILSLDSLLIYELNFLSPVYSFPYSFQIIVLIFHPLFYSIIIILCSYLYTYVVMYLCGNFWSNYFFISVFLS